MAAVHGDRSSFALGWRNNHDQRIRFEALSKIGDLNGRTVLDAGCGFGDIFEFLANRYPELSSYCGIDFIPEMIDATASRFRDHPKVTCICGNFMRLSLPVFDFVFASGSLNYASSDPAFIYKAIASLFALCNVGIGFNLLRWEKKDATLVAYEPEDIKSYCQTLSKNVILKMDYDADDFTVFIYRTVLKIPR